LCRNRKGVAKIKVTIERPEANLPTIEESGELCPYHQKQLTEKVAAMFVNKKPTD
jgi:hypothetical protein